jgi:hypothetical protein
MMEEGMETDPSTSETNEQAGDGGDQHYEICVHELAQIQSNYRSSVQTAC